MRVFFNRWQAVSAADVLGGVFIAQRNLLESLRSHVLIGSGLTPEIAEILIELFLAGSHLSSPEHADADGFVACRDLRVALGYSPGLLSRRIGWLCQRRWAETKRAVPNFAEGLHGNCQKVRVTELGRAKIAPVWRKYDLLAQRLLASVSPADLAAHYRINELISDKLCIPRLLMDDSAMLKESSPPSARPTKDSPREPGPAAAKLPEPAPEPVPKSFVPEPEKEFFD